MTVQDGLQVPPY